MLNSAAKFITGQAPVWRRDRRAFVLLLSVFGWSGFWFPWQGQPAAQTWSTVFKSASVERGDISCQMFNFFSLWCILDPAALVQTKREIEAGRTGVCRQTLSLFGALLHAPTPPYIRTVRIQYGKAVRFPVGSARLAAHIHEDRSAHTQ